jgi:hypothetical protein
MARDYIMIYRRLLADDQWARAINGSRAVGQVMP